MGYTDKGVGYQNTDTSMGAAHDMGAKAGTIRERVLTCLHASVTPLTADEIADRLEIDFISVRPRLTELRNDKRVKDSGIRKTGRFNKPQIAWELA